MGKRQVQTDPDIAVRRVDNPLSTFAQFKAELADGKPDPGIQRATVNLRSVMGGFGRFYGNEAEQRACARYRGLWDASQVGGGRAVDPSMEPVDGGWLNPEAVFEIGADARRLYGDLKAFLGLMDTKRLHFVVVGEWGPTPYAKWRYGVRQPDGRTVSRGKVEVRGIAARAAEFLDLVTQGGTARTRVDGDRPMSFTGEISSRRVA